MDLRIKDWLIALGVAVSAHAVLVLTALFWRDPPLSIERASISVELAQPVRAKPRSVAPRKTAAPPQPAQAEPERIPQPTPAITEAPTPPAPAPEPEAHTTAQTEKPVIYPPSRLTRAPRFRRRVDVTYPAAERAGGAEAEVLAEAIIDTSGNVVDVTIIQGAGPNFDAAVIAALRASTFAPGYLDSLPVMTRVQIPFRFKLK